MKDRMDPEGVSSVGGRPRAVLIVLNGPEEGRAFFLSDQRIPLQDAILTVGAEEGVDVRINYDPQLKKRLWLILRDDGFEIREHLSNEASALKIAYGEPCRLGNTWIVVQEFKTGER